MICNLFVRLNVSGFEDDQVPKLVSATIFRSFNDLTQYPVMPWVISDYTSQVLDLVSPSRTVLLVESLLPSPTTELSFTKIKLFSLS